LRSAAESGAINPRDIKVELAKRIIADFHSLDEAEAAAEEFDRIFKRKQTPTELKLWTVSYNLYKLPDLLVATDLIAGHTIAESKKEARRLIEQGGVRINGERITQLDYVVDLTEQDQEILLQIGKKLFLRVVGANP
jgi:tyrosyl-tRNA synthetase